MGIDRIGQRLQMLEDERAILRLLHDYGEHIDYGRADRWLGLFVADAAYELHYREGLSPSGYGKARIDGNRLIYQGRAMLADFIASHSHAPDIYHKHVVTGARIELDGDSAHSESYFMRIDEVGGTPVIRAAGRYLDALIRCSDGIWRFERRVAEIEARLTIAG